MNDALADDQRNNSISEKNLDEQDVQFVLLCKIDNARIIWNVLTALSHKKEGQFATVSVSGNGMKFTIEESKSFQGNAFLQE